MVDWYDRLAEPLDAALHGIDVTEQHFSTLHDGPMTFDAIDYPAAQTYLSGFERVDGTNWRVNINTTLYFEWGRDSDTKDTVLHPLADVLGETLAAFNATERITDYHPARIDIFSGQPDNSLIVAVNIEFRVMTLIDPGEF